MYLCVTRWPVLSVVCINTPVPRANWAAGPAAAQVGLVIIDRPGAGTWREAQSQVQSSRALAPGTSHSPAGPVLPGPATADPRVPGPVPTQPPLIPRQPEVETDSAAVAWFWPCVVYQDTVIYQSLSGHA